MFLLADFVIQSSSLLGIVVLILDIIAIVSLVAGRASVGHKLLWTLLILFLPVVGMVLYYLIGQSSRDAQVL